MFPPTAHTPFFSQAPRNTPTNGHMPFTHLNYQTTLLLLFFLPPPTTGLFRSVSFLLLIHVIHVFYGWLYLYTHSIITLCPASYASSSKSPLILPVYTHNMPVEIDFLGLQVEKRQQRRPQQNPQQQVPSSIRDIQKAVARLSPDVLRSVIAGNTIRPPRRHVPLPFSSSSTRTSSTAPLTIVYNGTISFFDATHDMAENVMKMAAEGARQLRLQRHLRGRVPAKGVGLIGDMPLLRKKSLQRFLEKRRERLASLAPYAGSASSSVGEVDGTDLSNRH